MRTSLSTSTGADPVLEIPDGIGFQAVQVDKGFAFEPHAQAVPRRISPSTTISRPGHPRAAEGRLQGGRSVVRFSSAITIATRRA